MSGARPDLQLHAIRVLALGNIQALVAEHPNLRVAESPLGNETWLARLHGVIQWVKGAYALGLGVGACANDDGRSVGVALDGKTLAFRIALDYDEKARKRDVARTGVKTGLDQHRSELPVNEMKTVSHCVDPMRSTRLRRSLRIDDSEERCERSGEGNGGLHRTREGDQGERGSIVW